MQERLAFQKLHILRTWPYSIWPFLQSPAASDHTHPSGISPTASQISKSVSLETCTSWIEAPSQKLLLNQHVCRSGFCVLIFWKSSWILPLSKCVDRNIEKLRDPNHNLQQLENQYIGLCDLDPSYYQHRFESYTNF